MTLNLDDILLQHDCRGISKLKDCLPKDNTLQVAQTIMQTDGPILLSTGFYVNGISETDGPPGTLVLCEALHKLGKQPILVTDHFCSLLFNRQVKEWLPIIEFPITTEAESIIFGNNLLDEINPSLLIAVERCGQSQNGHYYNMRGKDITPYTARIDCLFRNHTQTIGVGDGGNEIGMGLLYEQINQYPDLIPYPTVTPAGQLVITSVSNWAAYGLTAALAQLSGKDLLPQFEDIWAIVSEMVALGSTDGPSGKVALLVDGFDEQINREVVDSIRNWLTQSNGES